MTKIFDSLTNTQLLQLLGKLQFLPMTTVEKDYYLCMDTNAMIAFGDDFDIILDGDRIVLLDEEKNRRSYIIQKVS